MDSILLSTRQAFGRRQLLIISTFIPIFLLARFWLGLVSSNIMDPYLDEYFHIRQAKSYCAGDFEWDPMITTPPGLYAYGILLIMAARGSCSIYNLRWTSAVAIGLLATVLAECKALLEGGTHPAGEKTKGKHENYISPYAIHSAINICLFPPLFFFSGLYYTDIISITVVLYSYLVFLRKGKGLTGLSYGFDAVIGGILALLMRQTNIFWVAIFLALLEWTRTCSSMDYKPFSRTNFQEGYFAWGQKSLVFFARGNLHDPPLAHSSVVDMLVTGISIGVSAIARLPLLLRQIYPFIVLLGIFASFVYANGGVVLGDKTAHVAQIHLPQMLYIWPFMTILSFPMVYPYVIGMIIVAVNLARNPMSVFTIKNLIFVGWTVVSLASILVVVHFNTIIHKYTLADNRHYVFYAFRWTIRRNAYIKYLLAPIYIVCFLLAYQTLSGAQPATLSTEANDIKNVATETATEAKSKKEGNNTTDTLIKEEKSNFANTTIRPNTTFFLIWLLTSTLSLVTAPLVEPRYYLIPWLMWRLHTPTLLQTAPTTRKSKTKSKSKANMLKSTLQYWAYKGHDHRLWIETAWYLVINAVTGYVLLYRGFEWENEPGIVQRFMW